MTYKYTKYKISIMRWKQKGLWGLLSPELIKEDNSTMISTTDESSNNESLTRLDPSKAERILGLRLPMTWSMDQEYNFRNNQIQTLASKVEKSPFQPHDAQMAYQSGY